MEYLEWLIKNPALILIFIDMLAALYCVYKEKMNLEFFWLTLAIIEAIFYAKNNLNLNFYLQ